MNLLSPIAAVMLSAVLPQQAQQERDAMRAALAAFEVERAAPFDALVRRLGAREPSRPFDPAALAATAVTSPESEIAWWHVELKHALDQLVVGNERECARSTQLVKGQSALFHWRFGQDLESLSQAATAKTLFEALLADFDKRLPSPAPVDEKALLLRGLLLDLMGRHSESVSQIEAIEHFALCANGDPFLQLKSLYRSVERERAGQFTEAIELLLQPGVDCASVLADFDSAQSTRMGLMLLQIGRSRDGAAALQLVVDLAPGSPDAELARAALLQIDALIEPTPARLRAIYVDPTTPGFTLPYTEGVRRRFALDAMGVLGGDAALQELSRTWNAGFRDAVIGLARLHDERARPMLVSVVEHGPREWLGPALDGLAGLEGDAKTYLPAAMTTLATKPLSTKLADHEGFVDAAPIDRTARAICGGGPPLTHIEAMTPEDVASAWRAWIQAGPGH